MAQGEMNEALEKARAQPGNANRNPDGHNGVELRVGRRFMRGHYEEFGARRNKDNPNITNMARVAELVWEAALRGERWAIKELGNRIDGLAVHFDANLTAALAEHDARRPDLSNLTDEQMLERMEALTARVRAKLELKQKKQQLAELEDEHVELQRHKSGEPPIVIDIAPIDIKKPEAE